MPRTDRTTHDWIPEAQQERGYQQTERLVALIDGYVLIISPLHAQQLATDHAALRQDTAEGVRTLKPSPAVLRLLGTQHTGAVNLRAKPQVQSGGVIPHPANLMVADPALQRAGQVIESEFLGRARLLTRNDFLNVHEQWGGHYIFTEAHGRVSLACGHERSHVIPTFPLNHPLILSDQTEPGDYVQIHATGEIARTERVDGTHITIRPVVLLPEDNDDEPAILASETRTVDAAEIIRFLRGDQVTRSTVIRAPQHLMN